jgi:hypothetical protein
MTKTILIILVKVSSHKVERTEMWVNIMTSWDASVSVHWLVHCVQRCALIARVTSRLPMRYLPRKKVVLFYKNSKSCNHNMKSETHFNFLRQFYDFQEFFKINFL